MQGKKLYVGNLSYSVNDDKLKELFSQFGTVQDAVVIKDKFTERSKGFGFVEFSSSAEAENAANSMNGKEHEGRALKVNEAKQREKREGRRGGGQRDNY